MMKLETESLAAIFCYDNVSNHATSAGIYVDGGNSVIIERNVSHGNGYGIEIGAEEDGLTYGVTVRNNILYNNQGGGIELGGYDPLTTGEVRDCVIRNNSFYSNNTYFDGVGELHMTKASNCTIQNNIFYTSEQKALLSVAEIDPQSGNVINYNCWNTPNSDPEDIVVRWRHVNYTTFDNYKLAVAQDLNSDFLNPGFELASESPNFHLTMGSFCVNTGDPATVVDDNEKDFDGNPRVLDTLIDKGAIEYNAFLTTIQPLLATYSLTPNPATSTVNLRLKGDAGFGTFTIYDNLGHTLLKQTIRLPETTIDVSGLPDGIYITDMNTSGWTSK